MTISGVEAPGILTRPDIRRAEPTLGKVAVLYTTPESVLDDYGRLMNLADYRSALVPGVETLLKVNISWQHYYPACSSRAVADRRGGERVTSRRLRRPAGCA